MIRILIVFYNDLVMLISLIDLHTLHNNAYMSIFSEKSCLDFQRNAFIQRKYILFYIFVALPYINDNKSRPVIYV